MFRVTTFSAGLVSAVGLRSGADGVALLSAFGLLASGAQLVGASLPMALLPDVAASLAEGVYERKMVRRYVSYAMAASTLVCGLSMSAFTPATSALFGGSDVARLLDDAAAFGVLSGTLVASSAMSGLLNCMQRGKQNFAAVVASGVLTFAAVAFGMPTPWVATLPYAIHTACALPLIVASRGPALPHLLRPRGLPH
jgi:O-antigen/teichoic acid export membrane protein